MTRAAVAWLACACACAASPATPAPPMSSLEARYRLAVRGAGSAPASTTTQVYRSVLARSLFSRCRMWPHDSRLYDLRAPDCGALWSATLGFARLLLEVSASPRLLRPVLVDGEVRWFDLPPAGSCAP